MNTTTLKLVTILLLSLSVFCLSAQDLQTPEAFFGFKPGSDRQLFKYDRLIEYLRLLDNGSERLKMIEIGKSPLNKPMYIAFISSAENITRLEELKKINHDLAMDPDLSAIQREQYVSDGKVFVLATLSMHSGEVAPSQSAPLIAYELITSADPDIINWLDRVVFMMVPCHNPDGMDMIIDHYHKYKGSKYEGSSMPGIYHKYVGHDNNRDFVTLTQSDTRAIARIYNLDWFPQVMVEKHQMGSRGPRYFVPPNHDPIAENIDAGIWNWGGIFGAHLIKDMTAAGLAGVSQHYLFDDYWPGSTETCIWKNVIGFLTEAASAKYATPVYIEPTELAVYGKGLSEYKKSINMPLVWPGGWWRLGDIVQYEIVSTKSILRTAALYHDDILTFRNNLCRREVERGKTDAPFYFAFPVRQHDQSELVNLVQLLREHGVTVYQLNRDVADNDILLKEGDVVIPLAQPFRPFIKEVLERQKYPVRHYTPDGEIIKPYDITSWSLPLHKGLTVEQINSKSALLESALIPVMESFNFNSPAPAGYQLAVFSANNNESYLAAFSAQAKELDVYRMERDKEINGQTIAAGSFVIEPSKTLDKIITQLQVSPSYINTSVDLPKKLIKPSKIALVETYFHDMDAGWTRYVLDTYQIPYTVLRPYDLSKTNLTGKYNVLIFPDADKSVLFSGKWKSDDEYYISSYPPEFTRGMEKEGLQKVLKFVNDGGLIVAWGRSSNLFKGALEIEHSKSEKEEFQLPFSDISENLGKEGFYCPGSFVRILLTPDHPLTYGLTDEIGVFFRGRPVFTTSIPNFDMDRRVIAHFPEQKILLSGYIEKAEKIANKSAMIWIKKGKGQLVLIGFNPQFRASTPVSYKLLFNSILLN